MIKTYLIVGGALIFSVIMAIFALVMFLKSRKTARELEYVTDNLFKHVNRSVDNIKKLERIENNINSSINRLNKSINEVSKKYKAVNTNVKNKARNKGWRPKANAKPVDKTK